MTSKKIRYFSRNCEQLIFFSNCSLKDLLPGFRCELYRSGILLLMETITALTFFLPFVKDMKIV